eukprot:1352044-Amphidinium_carterae.1
MLNGAACYLLSEVLGDLAGTCSLVAEAGERAQQPGVKADGGASSAGKQHEALLRHPVKN